MSFVLEIFIKKTTSEFVILAVYVDEINIIGTLEEVKNPIEFLKK